MYRFIDTLYIRLLITALLLCLVPAASYAGQEQPAASSAKQQEPAVSKAPQKALQAPAPQRKGLQQRIDFGNAQILGQSIKSGAVYLMHRKKSDIKNMLEVRQNYREEIKEDFGLEKTAISQSKAETKDMSKQ